MSKLLIRGFLVFCLIFAAVIGYGLYRFKGGSAVSYLQIPDEIVSSNMLPAEAAAPNRLVRRVQLETDKAGQVNFVVDRPAAFPQAMVPVVIVLGDAQGQIARHIADFAGRNAVIGYKWPLSNFSKMAARNGPVVAMSEARKDLLSTPGQVLAVVKWLRQQQWVDPSRISLVGVGPGAVVVPAVYSLSVSYAHAMEGVNAIPPIGWSVIAFGAADFRSLTEDSQVLGQVAQELSGKPVEGETLAGAIDLFLWPLDPMEYLDAFEGPLLVLDGGEATPLARSSRSSLLAHVPANAKVRIYGEPEDPNDIDQALEAENRLNANKTPAGAMAWGAEVGAQWLYDHGAINAPEWERLENFELDGLLTDVLAIEALKGDQDKGIDEPGSYTAE